MSNSEVGTIGAAIIGYGGAFNMGRHHGQAIEGAGMKVVAACDIDAARVATAAEDFPGIDTYTSVDELLKNPKVDLCIIILPHNLHASVSVQCSNAGKHVVVEKPMCTSVAEADAMVEAASKAGKMLSVFHNRRWDGDFVTIRELIQQGMIGDVFHLEACMGGMHEPGSWWRTNKQISGGAMFDWGAHIIDWIFHFVPEEMAGVDGYFHKLRWHNVTNEDHTELVIRFAGGQTAQVEMSSLAASSKPRWRILGTHGAIVMQNWNEIEVTVDHKGHLAKFTMKPKDSDWPAYYRNIAGHLMQGEDLVVKADEARRIIAAIEAAEQSSGQKSTVVPAYP